EKKEVKIDEDALALLVHNADGSVRDGLSVLDQCLSTGENPITRDIILDFLGTTGNEFFVNLTSRIIEKDVSGAFLLLDQILREGKDVKQLLKDFSEHYRNLLVAKFIDNPSEVLNLSAENIDMLKCQANLLDIQDIDRAITTLSRAVNEARYSTQPRVLFEMTIVEISMAIKTNIPVQTAKTEREPAKIEKEIDTIKKESVSNPEKPNESKEQAISQESYKESSQAIFTPIPQPNADNEYNFNEIWNKIMELGIKEKPSFKMYESTKIIEINDENIVLLMKNNGLVSLAKSNEEFIEGLFETVMGVKKSLRFTVSDAYQNEPKMTKEETIANKIKEQFNVDDIIIEK
ncbi:MAG: hypothetical protein HUJ63_08870, partial [Enterococcus sp.]|nr:hypothetical protein [Enterococcus sp.]